MNLPSVWLQELTWEDVELYLKEKDTIIFPVGSTEQHGPAGPLGLDSYVAISLAEDVCKQTGILTAPPLWFGDSSHHLEFQGTISLRTETLIEVTKDVVTSLCHHGFKKVIVINGHKSANLPALKTALKSLHQDKLDALFALADPMLLARGIAKELKETREHHAGELEVSQVWHKFPHLIKEDKLTTEEVDLKEIFSEFTTDDLFGGGGDSIEVFWNSKEQKQIAPTGSFTPSQAASREKGARYHDYMVDNLTRFINWMENYKGPIGPKN